MTAADDTPEPGTPTQPSRPAASALEPLVLPAEPPVPPIDPSSSRPAPSLAELERIAEPATYRRAPRIGRFIATGALVGVVLGLVVAVVASSGPGSGDGAGLVSFLDGDGSVRLLTALAFAVVGALVAAVIAVRADRRSVGAR